MVPLVPGWLFWGAQGVHSGIATLPVVIFALLVPTWLLLFGTGQTRSVECILISFAMPEVAVGAHFKFFVYFVFSCMPACFRWRDKLLVFT